MGILRPATPGFICTLVATILLAVVSFCVPFLKSVYFLKASISEGGYNGTVTFGTLGYCLELSNGTTCSKASVGYELGETFHCTLIFWDQYFAVKISTVLLAMTCPLVFPTWLSSG